MSEYFWVENIKESIQINVAQKQEKWEKRWWCINKADKKDEKIKKTENIK